ncbi:glucosaminidase domain-containing protein [Enterococcus sp. DIV0187]|uniref:glucosaminidase domain-containing protein n=1 Tax=Enterococcus sp. DIV0187 TaxID=2774644 RepID=UPI003F216FED
MKKKYIGAGLLVTCIVAIHSVQGTDLHASNLTVESSQEKVITETSNETTSTSEYSVNTSTANTTKNNRHQEQIGTLKTNESKSAQADTQQKDTKESDSNTHNSSEESTPSTNKDTSSSIKEESSTQSSKESSSSKQADSSTKGSSTSRIENSEQTTPSSTTETSAGITTSTDKMQTETTKPSAPISDVPAEIPKKKEVSPVKEVTIPEVASTPSTGQFPTIRENTDLSNLTTVELDPSLRVSEMAESDLNGFELPLLSSFESKEPAIFVYEGIKQLGKEAAEETLNEESNQPEQLESSSEQNDFKDPNQLIDSLTKRLFDQSVDQIQKSNRSFEEKEIGDLLYENGSLKGIYLGDSRYLTVDKKNLKESTEDSLTVQIKILENKEKNQSIQRINFPTLTDYGKGLEKSYPANMNYQTNEQTQAFIQKIAENSQDLGTKYDVFASVMIAQAILESGSGTSTLSMSPHYNLFGVKGSYQGQSADFATQEDRGNGQMYSIRSSFRSYPSYGESLGDYVSLIREGIQGNKAYYEGSWRSKAKNYLKAADNLTGKYATDTTYNRKISSLIAAYHLTQYDKEKKATTPISVGTTCAVLTGKNTIPEEYRKRMAIPEYDGKNYNTSGSYPIGQCTWYAYNRMAQLGKPVDEFMGNGGQWGAKARLLGYCVTSEPKSGYLVSFTPGSAGSDPAYGHVAFVEAVGLNGILISEGNVVGGTTISYRVINNDLARSSLVTYLSPK